MENGIFFKNKLAHTTMFPLGLQIDKAEGIYIYDKNGNAYMDMVSGIGVNNIGHGVKPVIQAIKDQLDRHMHVMVYGEYLQESQIAAAKELCSLLPTTLQTAFFVNSGTEANEAALKLAKRVTRRSKIVSFKGAYHGSTHGSLSVSGNEKKKFAFRPLLPEVYFIRFNEPNDLHLIDDKTACVIMETIQGDAGIRIPDATYMTALRQRCTQVGALLILDEIQCGMGRSGTWFAFEQYGIVPDVLTLGKALAGGMPVGCFVSSEENMRQLTHDPILGHISTFAGHPVICAAVASTIQHMKNEKLVEQAEKKGLYLANAIRQLPGVIDVRQRGLYFAIDLKDEETVYKVVEENLKQGVISFFFLSCPSSFRIAPPLSITYQEIDLFLEVLRKTLSSL